MLTVHHIVGSVPSMVYEGGVVIWTRGGDGPDDPRPAVRQWFVEAGMPELSFDGAPATYGVGVNRVDHHETSLRSGRLFTFVDT